MYRLAGAVRSHDHGRKYERQSDVQTASPEIILFITEPRRATNNHQNSYLGGSLTGSGRNRTPPRRPPLTSVSLFSQLMSAKKKHKQKRETRLVFRVSRLFLQRPRAAAVVVVSAGRTLTCHQKKKDIGGIRALLLHIRQLIAPR